MDSDRPRPSVEPLVQETLDEHRECMEAVARVETCLEGHPDRGWAAGLLAELRRMTDTLSCHFAEEATGPLYREVPLEHPRFAGRLLKLEAEHGEIVEHARATIVRAEELQDPQPYELHEFNAQVQLLVARIRRHEAEENEIVIEAHWDTLGTHD